MTRAGRLAPCIPVVVATTVAAWLVPAGCSWDYVVDPALADAGGDAPRADAADAGSYTLPDGRVCTGHDEDRDGVPDECDNCPNVANADQDGPSVGAACAPDPAFVSSASRLLFDPLRSLSEWKTFGSGAGAFVLAPDGDAFEGGSLADELRFVSASTGAGASAAAVTTTLALIEESTDTTKLPGTAGLLLRIGADVAPRFFLCAVSAFNGFAIARAPDSGCDGGLCAPFVLPLAGDAGVAQKSIPADVPHALGDVLGVRMSVTAGGGDAGTGEVECRIFDPKRPETLASADPKYVLRAPVAASRWLPSGEVGLYAQRAKAVFGSIDVLRGP